MAAPKKKAVTEDPNSDNSVTALLLKKRRTRGLKPWKPGQSGNPNGRPPRLVGTVIKELEAAGYKRVARADVEELYEYLLNLDSEQLATVASDPSLPAFLTIAAQRMISGKGLEAIEIILNRAYGQAAQRQETEVTLKHDVKDASALSQLIAESGFIPAPAGNHPDKG